MKRRDVLKALPIGAMAAAAPFAFGGFAGRAFAQNPLLNTLLNAQSLDGKSVVIINLQGGNDGINTIIPYTDPLYYKNRPRVGWSGTDQTIQSLLKSYQLGTSGMAMNPNMDNATPSGNASFWKLWSEGKLAVLQNVGYADPNLSHFRSTDIWNQATDSEVVLSTGWVGRYLQNLDPNYPTDVQPGTDPLGIQIFPSLSPVFQGTSIEMGLAVTDPSKYDAAASYTDPTPTTTNAGFELDFVRQTLIQSDTFGARFKTLFPKTPKDKYAYDMNNPLAVQLQKVGWCIAAGMTTKVYFVNIGSFDTHVNQTSNLNGASAGQGLLLNWLADAISTFQANMEDAKVDQNVIGMTYSEFGRRVDDNASFGTDHGTAAPMFVFGTGVNGGLYGANPGLDTTDRSMTDIYGNLLWRFDFRQVYASVLGDWFGLAPAMRKAILQPNNQSDPERFAFEFPLNGSSTTQSLFKNPQAVGQSPAPSNFMLYQNSPNPFTGTTTIKFSLAQAAPATLEIFDVRGSLLATPISARLSAGEHQANFDASRLSSGTYFYRLEVGGNVQTKRMQLVR
jgi:uncharacterized protein (DUF1501 family)